MKFWRNRPVGLAAIVVFAGIAGVAVWLAQRDAQHVARPAATSPRLPAAAPRPEAAPDSFAAMLETLRPREVPRLLEYLATLPPAAERTAIAAELLRRWGLEAPAAAIDYVVRDAHSANPLLAGLLTEPLQEQTIAEKVRDSSSDALASVLAALFANWAANDPKAAAAEARQLESASERELMLQVVAETWARHDLPAVVDWLRRLPVGPEHTRVLQSIGREWAAQDPYACGVYASALPEGVARSLLLKTVAENWAARDMPSTMAWIKAMPEDGRSGEVVRSALAALAQTQPDAAAEWLRQLPEGAGQREGLDLVLNLWAARDLSAAVSWFQTLPLGSLRDHALPMLIPAWAAIDPWGAIEAAMSVSEHAGHTSQLEQAARIWLERDPAAARAWLIEANLPAEMRARLSGP